MKYSIAPLLGSLIFASSLSLSAQTFVEDSSPTPGINTFSRIDGLPVGGANTTGVGDGIVFSNNVGGGIPDPYAINPIGIAITEITTDSGTFTAYDFCAELFVGPNTSPSYSVAQGFGSLDANQQVLVARLFSNTLNGLVTSYGGGDRTNAGIIGAAIQLALWEIIEDPIAAFNPSLDASDPLAGDLSILSYSASYSGDAKASVELAQSYLTSLDTWSDEGGLNYYYATNATDQDRLWVTIDAIPEPSSALLGLLGMSFLLRRKRD